MAETPSSNGVEEPGWLVSGNESELLLNIVISNVPKLLTGTNQKVRG